MAMWDLDDVMSLVHNGINVVGIGYTIYLGSEFEHEMLTEATSMIRWALGLITVVWMYPRGKAVEENEMDPQLISGATGVAACLGADFAKVNYPKAWDGKTRPESLAVAAEQLEEQALFAAEEVVYRRMSFYSVFIIKFTFRDVKALLQVEISIKKILNLQ